MIRRRTPADRAVAFVRKLNEPKRRKKKGLRVAASLRVQVEQEFRDAQRRRA